MDEELILTEEVIPAERPPENKREVFLNPPDWRYQVACEYLECERAGKAPVIPTDPVILLTIRALRAFRRIPNRLYMDAMWNTTEEVIRLGTTMRHSAIVAEMEAHLISGHTSQDLKDCNSMIPPKIYTMYNQIFFDLTGITAVHSWIHDFLIEPERHSSNQILLRSRILAYLSSAEDGAKSAVFGLPSRNVNDLLKKIGANERQKELFDYVIKKTKIPQETYVMLMETALKSMTDRDFQEHMRDRDEAGSGSLEELSDGIEQGIRSYSQQEIAEASAAGLDFTNQYTAFLTHKEASNG